MNARFPVYAVDFAAEAAGKRVASTKRRVRWRFGFPSQEAMERGETGTACRGSEHEVNMVWSLTSGKRQITMDQKEVHYSVGRSGKFEFSWTMKGNHVLKVVAFASAPVNNPQFRQFDLSVDGQSFFHMPKIFEVGLAGPPQAHSRVPGDYSQYQYEQSPRDREEQDLQAAIAASLQESRSHLQRNNRALPPSGPAPAPATASRGADLLDMSAPAGAPPMPSVQVPPPAAFAPPAPAPFMSPASVATAPQSFQSPPPYMSPAGYSVASAPPPQQPVAGYLPAPPGSMPPGAPVPPPAAPVAPMPMPAPVAPPAPALLPPVGAAPSGVPPAFAGQQPVPADDDPFAPKPPSQNEVLSSIMDAYASSGAMPATPGAPVPQPNFNTPNGAVNGTANGHAPATPGQPSLSMNAPLALGATEEDGKPKTEIEKAMNNLVNFDDINEPAEKELKLTMMKEEESKKRNPNKSAPLPPVATNMVGSGATLSQIQQVKPEMTPKDPSSIMKPPPQLFSPEAVHAGALVVHGAPMPGQGPPPIQRGFGVGYGGPPPQQYNGYQR